ncbi:uncharacterized protein [Phaseolus vulgaris]|uniref:uncharacterized protein n=1 Tax=Phaseolus vulgaris TaxID=3885 RepID=UPI0035CBE63F
MKYLVVAIEYFTKWIEAEPVAQIIAHRVEHFVWRNIFRIKQVFTSVEHPQTNGQVNSSNRVLIRGLKRRLKKAKGTWPEEVPLILWAYHTIPQSTTKEMPFSLVYGSDVMVLVEIQESSPRFQNFVVEESNEGRKVNLDILDEV